MKVLFRTLFSALTAVALGGTAPAAPTISTPLATASETVAEQTSPETADTRLFDYPSYYLLAGGTDTFAPLKTGLPAGITLMLDDGAAIEELRADGWSISVTDNVLSVTAPHTAEGNYQIPVIVTYPDQSTQTASVTIFVDYLVNINPSSLIPRWPGFQSSVAP